MWWHNDGFWNERNKCGKCFPSKTRHWKQRQSVLLRKRNFWQQTRLKKNCEIIRRKNTELFLKTKYSDSVDSNPVKKRAGWWPGPSLSNRGPRAKIVLGAPHSLFFLLTRFLKKFLKNAYFSSSWAPSSSDPWPVAGGQKEKVGLLMTVIPASMRPA